MSASKPTLASVRRAFRTIVWPRRWLLARGLALLVVNRLSGLVLPGAVGYLIDRIVLPRDTATLGRLLAVVGGAVAVQAVTSFLLTRLLSVEAQNLIKELRAKVQAHVIHLPVSYFDRTKSGVVVSRIMSDVEGVRNIVGTGIVQLLGGILTSSVALVILLRMDAVLTAVAIVPLVLFALISMKAFRRLRPIFRKRGAIMAEVTGRLTESIGGVRVIKGFHAEERERSVFAAGVERIFDNVKTTLTTTAFVTSASTLLMGVASIAILGIGGTRMVAGELQTGEFTSFMLYLGFLVAPIIQMASIGTQITEAFAGLDRTEEVFAELREGAEPERTRTLDAFAGAITFEDVSFAYPGGADVLHGVTLDAPAGTVTALVGSSGAGKTTLAGLAASFLKPTQGVVRVDGTDLATVRLSDYRRRLGVVLQDDFLFEGTIRENVLFGRPDADERALAEAIEAAHVRDFTDAFPEGLETVIGERGIKLSGGQRQRVSIARALLADPRILILDEATSNLDSESERLIQKSLETLMRGRTAFVIAHRLSTIRAADQIVVLEGGRIVERGTHEELIAAAGRYFQLYTYQARI